jgi:hypothetical protein
MHLSLAAFKAMVRDQFFVLQLEGNRAIDVLAAMIPQADARRSLLEQARAIVAAGDAPVPGERERLDRLSQLLEGSAKNSAKPAPGATASSA